MAFKRQEEGPGTPAASKGPTSADQAQSEGRVHPTTSPRSPWARQSLPQSRGMHIFCSLASLSLPPWQQANNAGAPEPAPKGVATAADEGQWGFGADGGDNKADDDDDDGGADEPAEAPLGLRLHNAVLSRSLRRETLAATVGSVEWSRSVGGGTVAQKLRLRERVIAFRALHLVITLVVWQHFFYNKLREKQAATPETATNYRWKVLVPPVEFGLMHAILLQLALIPLTVSRSLLAWVATKTSVLPLEHIMTLHIHIGYSFCVIMVGSSLLFFAFFGKLCYEFREGTEKVDMCAKFRTEIMATGLAILGITLVIFITSYLRGRMRFEWFYSMHIVAVGALYCGAIVHTLDDEFRKGSKAGKARSQTFRWLIGSVAVFLADRAWRVLTQESRVPVVSARCHADGGSVTLRLVKPWWFSFAPGQYVHLQVPAIDGVWHPFSVGSSPDASVVTIIMVVQGEGEWTHSVAAMVRAGTLTRVNLRGPFGNPVGPPCSAAAANNVVAVGSGTGIVPMVSLLKERAERLELLSAAGLSRTQSTMADRQMAAQRAWCLGANVSPATYERIRHVQLVFRSKRLAAWRRGEAPMPAFFRDAMARASSPRGLWVVVGVVLWGCCEAACASLVLSWSNLQPPAAKTPGMTWALEAMSMALVLPFVAVLAAWVFRRSRAEQSPTLCVHVLALAVMVGVTAHLGAGGRFENLVPMEQIALVGFSAWRVGAAWAYRLCSARNGGASGGGGGGGGASSSSSSLWSGVESFRFLWVTRSADLVTGVLRDLERTFARVEESMRSNSGGVSGNGGANADGGTGTLDGVVGTAAFPQLEVKVWCTDRNPRRVAELKAWLKGTRFEPLVVLGRPDFGAELAVSMRRHITAPSFANRLPGEKKACAVTFCGSPVVSDALFRAVRRCGQLATVSGSADFQFTFRTESYSNMPKTKSQLVLEREQAGSDGGGVGGGGVVRPSRLDKQRRKSDQWSNMRSSLVNVNPTVSVGDDRFETARDDSDDDDGDGDGESAGEGSCATRQRKSRAAWAEEESM